MATSEAILIPETDEASRAANELAVVRDWNRDPPVDVVGLAEHLGINVRESLQLPDHIAGKLFLSKKHGGESGYAIFINRNDARTRKRFTVAHEIGHFILHRNYLEGSVEDDIHYRSSRLRSWQETEANRFAARLLMPAAQLRRALDEHDGDRAEVAQLFQVSEQALCIRLGDPT